MSPDISSAQLCSPPSQRWLRLSSICAEDVSREAADYVWRALTGVEAAVFRCIDGAGWLVPAGKGHLSVALQFYAGGEPPDPRMKSFRGWYSIDVPVHLPTVAELPLADLTRVMRRHVIDALTSPSVVHALGYPLLYPSYAPPATELEGYRHFDLPTSVEEVDARTTAGNAAIKARFADRKKAYREAD